MTARDIALAPLLVVLVLGALLIGLILHVLGAASSNVQRVFLQGQRR